MFDNVNIRCIDSFERRKIVFFCASISRALVMNERPIAYAPGKKSICYVLLIVLCGISFFLSGTLFMSIKRTILQIRTSKIDLYLWTPQLCINFLIIIIIYRRPHRTGKFYNTISSPFSTYFNYSPRTSLML